MADTSSSRASYRTSSVASGGLAETVMHSQCCRLSGRIADSASHKAGDAEMGSGRASHRLEDRTWTWS